MFVVSKEFIPDFSLRNKIWKTNTYLTSIWNRITKNIIYTFLQIQIISIQQWAVFDANPGMEVIRNAKILLTVLQLFWKDSMNKIVWVIWKVAMDYIRQQPASKLKEKSVSFLNIKIQIQSNTRIIYLLCKKLRNTFESNRATYVCHLKKIGRNSIWHIFNSPFRMALCTTIYNKY